MSPVSLFLIPVGIAIIAALCMFGGSLFGMWLQKRLPEHHLDKESHETVKVGIGVIATVTALVLGLLVSSAKNTYDTLNTGLVKVSASIILLDQTLAEYGPEAQPIRAQLRDNLTATIARLWPSQSANAPVLASIEKSHGLENLQIALEQLTPQTNLQRESLADARQIAGELMQTRWLLIEQAQTQLPTPFLVVLIFWLTIIFMSFGLFAPRHGTVIVVMFNCALAMAAAIFLILELSQPLTGFIRLSSASMLDALRHLSQQ
jgi:hypothetical protein